MRTPRARAGRSVRRSDSARVVQALQSRGIQPGARYVTCVASAQASSGPQQHRDHTPQSSASLRPTGWPTTMAQELALALPFAGIGSPFTTPSRWGHHRSATMRATAKTSCADVQKTARPNPQPKPTSSSAGSPSGAASDISAAMPPRLEAKVATDAAIAIAARSAPVARARTRVGGEQQRQGPRAHATTAVDNTSAQAITHNVTAGTTLRQKACGKPPSSAHDRASTLPTSGPGRTVRFSSSSSRSWKFSWSPGLLRSSRVSTLSHEERDNMLNVTRLAGALAAGPG
mmetsp:Transcript_84708/g.244881  ORF Transcript_84708/g.244881 Transcript_84708/m.244881 type:complete len:288 (+) Transcript_84708:306-1169(+)